MTQKYYYFLIVCLFLIVSCSGSGSGDNQRKVIERKNSTTPDISLEEKWEREEEERIRNQARLEKIKENFDQVNRNSKGPFGLNVYQTIKGRQLVMRGGVIVDPVGELFFVSAYPSDLAQRLREYDFYVGNLFTTNLYEIYGKYYVSDENSRKKYSYAYDVNEMLENPSKRAYADLLNRLKHATLEKYYIQKNPTSKMAQGFRTRGISGIEYETVYYNNTISYLAKIVKNSEDYLVLYEIQKRWNLTGDSTKVTLESLRDLSAAIDSEIPANSNGKSEFRQIRNTIHNLIGPEVSSLLKSFLNNFSSNLSTTLREKIIYLKSQVDLYYAVSRSSLDHRFSQISATLSKEIINQLNYQFDDEELNIDVLTHIAQYTEALAKLRKVFETSKDVEIIHFLIKANQFLQVRLEKWNKIAAKNEKLSPSLLKIYSNMAFSAGLLTSIQREQIIAKITPNKILKGLESILWRADESARMSYESYVSDWTFVSPKVSGFIDDLLKSSILNEVSKFIVFLKAELPQSNREYTIMNEGEAYGRLVYLSKSDILNNSNKMISLNYKDIPIFEILPIDLGVVSGIITEEPQTPLSHVNIKSNARGTPNLYFPNAKLNEKFKEYLSKGTLVHFKISQEFGLQIEPATTTAAQKFWSSKRPTNMTKLRSNLTRRAIFSTDNLGNRDLDTVGAKAANYAEIQHLLGENVVRAAGAIPFAYYDEFLKKNGLDKWITKMLQDSNFQNDRATQILRLAELQKKITDAPLDKKFLNEVQDFLDSHFPSQKIRFRSSTNSEDLKNFSGAGLYTSTSYKPGSATKTIDVAIKTVWASVWNQRAFDERELFGIRHQDVYAGILLSPAYDKEEANGVAVSRNTSTVTVPGFDGAIYYNTQVGEDAITNPESGTVAEETLTYFNKKELAEQGSEAVEIHHKILKFSSESPSRSIMSAGELNLLSRYILKIHQHFKTIYDPKNKNPNFAVDIEFKIDDLGKGRKQVYLKQARPYVAP